MPRRYKPENIQNGETPYKVFRQLARTNQTYAREIADKTGVSYSDASTILNVFEEMDIVEKAERTKAQNYKINYEGIKQLFNRLWRQEQTFESFEEFLQAYCEDYTIHYKESTIGKMLQDHFLQGLHLFIDNDEVESFEELEDLYQRLLLKREVRESPYRFIQTAAEEHQQ